MDSWVIATTRPSCEHLAKNALKVHGFEPYYPLRIDAPEAKYGRVIERARPHFPGYVFYKLTPWWRNARSTEWLCEYVKRILVSVDAFGNVQPALITSDVIENLMAIERDGAIRPFEKKPRKFAVGALIRVVKGPFEGLIGTVNEIRSKRRVRVSFSIFGRASNCTLKEDQAVMA